MNIKISPYKTITNDPSRTVGLTTKLADYNYRLNQIINPLIDDSNKKPPMMKELKKKHSNSYKKIQLNPADKINAQNQQHWDHPLQRQNQKIKIYYQNQIKNLLGLNHKIQYQSEVKIKTLQKQKNQWKQFAMKLQIQNQNKFSNFSSNLQAPALSYQNMSRSPFKQENLSSAINKTNNQDQIPKLKYINNKLTSGLTKLNNQNQILKQQVTKLTKQLENSKNPIFLKYQVKNQNKIKNPVININFRSESPQLKERTHQSPSKLMQPKNHKHSHSRQRNDHSIHCHVAQGDPHKQIEKLRKVCHKMQKVIAERNQQLIKQKAKFLNLKYTNI